MKKISLSDIFLMGFVVMLTLQIDSCFTKLRKPEQMIRNEERLKILEEKRLEDSVTLALTRSMYDSLIALSWDRINSLENSKQPIKYAIKQIPVIVGSLDKEQLRAGANAY